MKHAGVQNTYFPLFIPEKLLKKEAEHIEHFAPEVAWVTHGGDSELEERLAVRPTSEVIMYDIISKWVRSWRDLPMKLNQWNNVVRWEFKHPTPFLRTREFLWNEGHSIYATEEEALKEREVILGIYLKVLREYLALPGILGRKSDSEKFAGGVASYSIEHIMPDKFAIQGPAWHYDGQKFAKAYDISFLNKEEKREYAYQNTYAISTRELGVMLATHGDDKGLVVPPKLSRIQVVIVPIYKTDNRDKVIKFAASIAEKLEGLRVHIDERDEYSPGWKFNQWELKGIPIRIELGEKEIAAKKLIVVPRDTLEKHTVDAAGIDATVTRMLEELNERLYEKAYKQLLSMITSVDTYDKMREVVEKKGGFAHSPWCGDEKCESKIKEETGAKITNMPLDQSDLHGMCICCGKKAKYMANFAKSY